MIVSSTILGSGKVVIILHGLFGEGKNWMSIAKELSSYFAINQVFLLKYFSVFRLI